MDDVPYYMILEYMDQGDLCKFLHFHRSSAMLGHSQLLDMCKQVASGMAYLESINQIHRDLACRNILVQSGMIVKIADFGMSQNLYSRDYYRVSGEACVRPCPLDAPRGRDLREIHHEGGRVVVRSSSLGDLQLCHAAVLGLTERRCSRNDPTWQAAGEARCLPGQGVLAGPG